MNKIIQELNGERATRKLPDFNPGDTIVVQVKVVEGDREEESRAQFLIYRAQDFARRGCRARVSDIQPFDQRSEREAPRCRAPRQALLPA